MKRIRGYYSVGEFLQGFERRSAVRSKKKVLVIDDVPSIRYALEETIRIKRYDCISATDGEEGVMMICQMKPDLIITDLVMP